MIYNVIIILFIISILSVLGVLFTGLVVMARGGETSKKYGNKLMRARVILQGITVFLFILLLIFTGAK